MVTIAERPAKIRPEELVYERVASTLIAPVAAGAEDHVLLSWVNPYYRKRNLLVLGIGTDQHDNSVYTWTFDDVELPFSGPARVGAVASPLWLPIPIVVTSTIELAITNNNLVAYPNEGTDVSDVVPYEGLIIGVWES